MEREIVMGGIGGQGVQLATKILATALNNENRYVMHFAAFGGTMRGGNVECTVVTGTEPLAAPPIIPQAWMTISMHPNTMPIVAPKTRPGGLLVVNASLVKDHGGLKDAAIVEIPASTMAEELNNIQGAAMILLGAICRATGLVSVDQLIEGLKALTPPYRQKSVLANAKAFETGDAYARKRLEGFAHQAWARAVA
ncbi:MAG: 2-oxoacid:acceptor oxidoreductase family protein [Dehalococcoidia bacterium]